MDRRTALSILAGGGAMTLAGCLSTGSDESEANSSSDDVGTQITTANSLQVTLDNLTVTNRLDKAGEHNHNLVKLEEGQIFILTRFKIRNNGTEKEKPPVPSDFSVVSSSGTRYGRLELTGKLSQPTSGVYYDPTTFTGVEYLEPGGATTGYVAFQVPESIESPALQIADVAKKGSNDTGISWALSNNQSYLVKYETEIQAPTEITQHKDAEVKVTVSNKGGKTGRWQGQLTLSNAGGWESNITSGDGVFATTIKGGQSASKTFTIDPIGATHNLKAFFDGKQIFSQIIKPPIRSFGESYITPAGLKMTVKSPQFVHKYTLRSDDDTSQITADSGRQFFICKMVAENTSNETIVPPVRDGVKIITNGEYHDARTSVVSEYIESPVSGPKYTNRVNVELKAGEKLSGWRVFGVSESLSLSDVTIAANAFGDHFDQARWKNKSK